jgi:hypothetical protein
VQLIIGILLLVVSISNSAASFFVVDGESFRVLLSGMIGTVAGLLTVRRIRFWQIAVVISATAYLWLVAHAATSMALEGEFRFLLSSFTLPLHDPRISMIAKVSLVWFQGVVPLILCVVAVLAAFGALYPTQQRETKGNAV